MQILMNLSEYCNALHLVYIITECGMTSLSISSVSTSAYFIVLPIAYLMCCRHRLLHCVVVIAYFIVLPSLLTLSLQCRQHYLKCCLLLVLAYKKWSDLIHCNTFLFTYLYIFIYKSLIIILH